MSCRQYPEQWVKTTIGDIAEVVAGGTPKAGNSENFAEPGTGIAWLTPADLSGYSEKYICHGSRDLSQIGYESSSAKLMPAGTVLFSSRAPIGYVAIAQNEISTNQGFKSFVFPYGVDSCYAYYYLKSIRDLAENLGTGTTFKEISISKAKTLPFVLPPMEEQKVVAEKLDTMLAMVENTKARLDSIPGILKRFRQSVLSTAVSGKLTEKYRELKIISGDGKLLAASLMQAHADNGGHARGNASKPTEEAHDLTDSDLPDSWGIAEMRDVCIPGRPITYGILKPGPEQDDGVPYIRVADFPDNKLNVSSIKRTSRAIDEAYKRARLSTGDLLLSIRGSVGRLIEVPACLDGANITQDSARLAVSPLVSSRYVYWSLLADSTQNRMSRAIRGVAIKGINIGDVRAIQVPIPPLEEQIEIVRRVENLFAFADNIEQQLNVALDRVNNLTQSILSKAFNGELTTSWREGNLELISGDNSAEVLLKNIKDELEVLKRQPKAKRKVVKNKTGKAMTKKIIKVKDALKAKSKPLSGQQLLTVAGYPSDCSTEQLEQFFLDIRDSLAREDIIKQSRDDDGQDWFALAEKK
ncbi:restriction endonuclease subunit S [Vibrio harveyi]|nr:restriction endonuclease subunit S [Vibrio harveyi]PNM55698.1 restriction endonuclease subunit S [Vibrio harveyi]